MPYDFTLSELENSEGFLQSPPETQRAIAREYIAQNGPDEVLNQYKSAVTDPEYQQLKPEERDLFRKSYSEFYGIDVPLEDVSFGTDVKDTVLSGLAGTSAIPKAAAMVAGWFGAEESKESLLDIAKTTEEFYRSGISKQGREVEQQPFLSEQDGKWFGNNAIKKVFMVSAESLPLMVATAPIGGGASAAISKAKFLPEFIRAVEGGSKAGQWSHNLITFGASEAGTSALVSAADAGEKVAKMPASVIAKSPVYQELIKQGLDPVSARAELRGIVEEETLKTQFAATLAGSAVAPGGGMAKLFQKGPRAGVVRETAEGVVTEGLQEGGQSGLEQFGENLTTQRNLDPTQSLSAGTGEAAALGLASGGLMGGGMSGGSKLLSLKDAQQVAQDVPLGADPEQTAAQIESATAPTPPPNITLGDLTQDEIEGIAAVQNKLSTADAAEIDRVRNHVLPLLREKNPLVAPHIERIVNERSKMLFDQMVPGTGVDMQQISTDDLMDDWAETETDVQAQADARGRSVRFEQLRGQTTTPDVTEVPTDETQDPQLQAPQTIETGTDTPILGQPTDEPTAEAGGGVVPVQAEVPVDEPTAETVPVEPVQAEETATTPLPQEKPNDTIQTIGNQDTPTQTTTVDDTGNTGTAPEGMREVATEPGGESVAAGQEVNTEPSEGQKDAGNYKKAHVNLDGMDISIENPVGSVRSGKDIQGREWQTELKADYGYIKGTKGKDKDHLDIFIKPGYTGGATDIFVVNQYDKDGKFDEHKAVLGAASEEEAMEIYNSNYEAGWTGGKNVTRVPLKTFKLWAKGVGPGKGPIKTTATAEPKVVAQPNVKTFEEAEQYDIYKTNIAGRGQMFAVRGDMPRGGGDRLFNTIEEAEEFIKEERERNEANADRIVERKKAEQEEEQRKEANKKLSITERRANATLDKPSNLRGFEKETRRSLMEKVVNKEIPYRVEAKETTDDAAKKRDEAIVERVRGKYLLTPKDRTRGSNPNIPEVKAAYEAIDRIEAGHTKQEYRLTNIENGNFFPISKTEYDYANSLTVPGSTPAPAPAPPLLARDDGYKYRVALVPVDERPASHLKYRIEMAREDSNDWFPSRFGFFQNEKDGPQRFAGRKGDLEKVEAYDPELKKMVDEDRAEKAAALTVNEKRAAAERARQDLRDRFEKIISGLTGKFKKTEYTKVMSDGKETATANVLGSLGYEKDGKSYNVVHPVTGYLVDAFDKLADAKAFILAADALGIKFDTAEEAQKKGFIDTLRNLSFAFNRESTPDEDLVKLLEGTVVVTPEPTTRTADIIKAEIKALQDKKEKTGEDSNKINDLQFELYDIETGAKYPDPENPAIAPLREKKKSLEAKNDRLTNKLSKMGSMVPPPIKAETQKEINRNAEQIEKIDVEIESLGTEPTTIDHTRIKPQDMIRFERGGREYTEAVIKVYGEDAGPYKNSYLVDLFGDKYIKQDEVIAVKHRDGSKQPVGPVDEPPLTRHKSTIQSINDGTITVEQYREAFESTVANREAIVAELQKLTKDGLFEFAGARIKYQYKNDKKDDVVKAVYHEMLSDFNLTDSISFTVGGGNYERNMMNALRDKVNAVTAQSLEEHAAAVKATQEERARRKEQITEGMKDPKTLEDLIAVMRSWMNEGKTFPEARMSLTLEQREAYDTLSGEKSRGERKGRADQQIRTAAVSTEGEIIETKHTKTGEPLFVVKSAERVDREIYNQWNSTAKRLGGYYSSYRGGGAVPGFQFKTVENAEAFLAYIGGNADQATAVSQERRNAFADNREQSAVERLREMANALTERADESLNRDRLANTSRRARMAASAEQQAESEKALAKTMNNIADAIASGDVKFLDRVRQKVQIEMLRRDVNTAKYAEKREKYKTYAEEQKHEGEPPTKETADYADFPRYTAFRSDLAKLGRQLSEKTGTKKLGESILKVADDVTAAYKKFAKENLLKVSGFVTKDGILPTFKTKKEAELSIDKSGYRGKAIVFTVKNGEHMIIFSPSEAKERGLWQGDDDKRITISDEFGEEVFTKATRKNVDIPWYFTTVRERKARLKSMGIETPQEYRAALREFITLQQQPSKPNKIKELERSMVGRANDGLDFFPTPATIAQTMVETADIKEGMSVLEPSAGMGHIAENIRETGVSPDVVEMSSSRRELLELKGFNVVGQDFMDVTEQYDRIIMNPPFSDRRDIQHVRHAYDLLKPGGRLVAIMGEGSFFGSDKKATAFREWLEELNGTSEKLEEGTFLDKSLPVNTGVAARMVVIDKPAVAGPDDTLKSETGENDNDTRRNSSNGSERIRQTDETGGGIRGLLTQRETVDPLTELKNPKFRRWFGRSAITTNGVPTILYHGTSDPDFLSKIFTFDFNRPPRQGSSQISALGAFLGNETIANAHSIGTEGTTHAFFVRIENPYIVTSKKLERIVTDNESATALRTRLQGEGYDGIIITDRAQVVIFDGNQVKSAERNNGEYSRELNDTLLSDPLTRREFIIQGGALVAWAAAGGDVVSATPRSFQEILADKNQTVHGALKHIAANSSSPRFRTMAEDLLTLLPEDGKIRLVVDPEPRPDAAGIAKIDRTNKRVTVTLYGQGLNESTLLHESWHAAVLARYDILNYYLANPGKLGNHQAAAALEQYRKVWMEFRDEVNRYAGGKKIPHWLRVPMENPDEFLTYALTDQETIKWMSEHEYRGKTLRERFIQAIKGFFNRVFRRAPTWIDAVNLTASDLVEAMKKDAPNFEAATKVLELFNKSTSAPLKASTVQAIYSKLGQVTFPGMKAQSVIPFLGKQGVKKAEIEAIGLDAWIAAKKPTDKVTQDDLNEFVQANMIEVEDVVLGESAGDKYRHWTDDAIKKEYESLSGRSSASLDRETLLDYLNDYLPPVKTTKTHFAQYTEPNADPGSYREMFVTAPPTKTVMKKGLDGWELVDGEGKVLATSFGINNPDEGFSQDQLRSMYGGVGVIMWRQKGETEHYVGVNWQDGHSQYSEIDNPIVRIRFNTETRDGKTYLRIEEMQGPSDSNQKLMPAYLRDNIYQLGSKRIIAHAKEQGYDGIIFAQKEGRTAGETQADRYSLEKVIDSVDWTKHGRKSTGFTYSINAHSTAGEDIKKSRITGEELVATIGKEAAEKIDNNVGYTESDQYGAHGTLEKIDLKVGGEGLKQLYDRQLPAMLEAYSKEKFVDGVLTLTDRTPLSFTLFAQSPPPATSTRPDRIDRLNLSDQWERFIYGVTDNNDPRRRVLARADVVNLSENLSENTDILTIERLRGKKTAEEALRFWEDKTVPLLRDLARAKLATADLDEYAHAMHTPERNKRMQQVNAKGFIDRVVEHLNSAEATRVNDEIIDIRSDVLMTGGTRADRQDRYLQVLDDLFTGIAAQRADVDAQQTALNNRTFTAAEIAKGTPANLQARIDARSAHLTEIERVRDRWELESPRFAGITDTEAADIVTRWKADPRYQALTAAHATLLEFGQLKLDILRESGQLSDVEYQSLVDGYDYYVPLHRDVEDDSRPVTGRVTGPTGSPIKVAKGSMLEVVHILAHSIQNVQTAINRKHKADAGRVLHNFAVANPDAGITVGKQKKEPRHDSEGNVVMYTAPREADNELYVRIDGERYTLTFDTKNATTKRFLESIKDADANLSGPMQALSKMVRILAMVNTTLSPEFIISNFSRDIQTAGIHMEDTEAKGLQARVLKNVFPAIRGILGAEYGKAGTHWGRIYRDFAANGGKIGWMQSYDGIKDLASQIESTSDLYRDGHVVKKSLRTVGDLITKTNTAIENGVRLAFYDQMIKTGATPSRAALAASNLTVDFTRRGAYSPAINALYMFFNAGVQGNVRMIKAITRSPRVGALVGGIVATGFALQFLAYATGGDDETGQPYIDGIESYIKERNMIFMKPGTKGEHFKIPMPYGYNGFYNIGAEIARAIHDHMSGRKYKVGQGAMRIVNTLLGTFNPLQSATITQALAPTVIDPFVMVAENKTWAGSDLMPKESPFGPNKADAYRTWKSTPPVIKSVAQGLHKLTGGKGEYDNTAMVDISPETIEMMYETITGSAGRFVKDMVSTPIRALTTDEPIESSKVPFKRRVYGEWSNRSISNRYYEQTEQVERFRKDYLAADTEERKKLATDPRYKMVNYTRDADNMLDKLREARNKAEAAGRPTKVIEERILKLQTEYLKRGTL